MNLARRETHQQLIARFDARLSMGRYDLLGGNCTFPLVLFLDERPLLLRSRVEGLAFFCYFHAAMQHAGLTRLATRIVAEEIRRRDRFRLWIEMRGEGPAGAHVLLARAILYCMAGPDGERIQMIEFSDHGLPGLERVWPAAGTITPRPEEAHHAEA
jgi:hypothetical protein